MHVYLFQLGGYIRANNKKEVPKHLF